MLNKFLGLLLVLTLVSCGNKEADRNAKLAKSSVMITNMSRRSGGSGVILVSTKTASGILTNKHVCEILKTGGFVVTDNGDTHMVTRFKTSLAHDLCLVVVNADLKVNVDLSDKAAKRYDGATIVGHPHLLPTVITKGHFSDVHTIPVQIGDRECTADERMSSTFGFYCALGGRLPVIKVYNAILVTGTIQPGSSGSPIFDDEDRLQALVFAGEGPIGYAEAVPFEFIYSFINDESKAVAFEFPDYNLDLLSMLKETKKNSNNNKKARK